MKKVAFLVITLLLLTTPSVLAGEIQLNQPDDVKVEETVTETTEETNEEVVVAETPVSEEIKQQTTVGKAMGFLGKFWFVGYIPLAALFIWLFWLISGKMLEYGRHRGNDVGVSCYIPIIRWFVLISSFRKGRKNIKYMKLDGDWPRVEEQGIVDYQGRKPVRTW